MNEKAHEDWLDRQLRETVPYIDDAGFTARVMQQLPRHQRHFQSLRAAILLVTAILASGLSFVLSGNGRFISADIERIATLPMLWIFVIALSCGILLGGVGLIAAISKTRELEYY
jgi:hypothetical protein